MIYDSHTVLCVECVRTWADPFSSSAVLDHGSSRPFYEPAHVFTSLWSKRLNTLMWDPLKSACIISPTKANCSQVRNFGPFFFFCNPNVICIFSNNPFPSCVSFITASNLFHILPADFQRLLAVFHTLVLPDIAVLTLPSCLARIFPIVLLLAK